MSLAGSDKSEGSPASPPLDRSKNEAEGKKDETETGYEANCMTKPSYLSNDDTSVDSTERFGDLQRVSELWLVTGSEFWENHTSLGKEHPGKQ